MESADRSILNFSRRYLEEILVGVVITDGSGKVIYVSDTCKELYGINKARCLGKHISILEEQGTFTPSAGMRVLQNRKTETVVQPDQYGEQLLVTGVPIFGDDGELEYVITYSSWNVSNYNELRDKYENVKKTNERIYNELSELRKKDMRFEMVAKSTKMKNILKLVEKIAPADISVIIKGEAGAGKGILAREIHRKSPRARGPFIDVNCSAYQGSVLRDELFGYLSGKGSAEKMGLCEMADRGTLVLEDVECLDPDIQRILLHLIKNRYYFKPGSEKIIEADTRILATTVRDLGQLAQDGLFNTELYYRLSIASITYPSLRERTEDITQLLDLFLEDFNAKYGRRKSFSEQAYSLLCCYDWPGNVCELKYLVQKMVLTVEEDVIQGHNLPSHISPYSSARYQSEIDLREYLDFHEKRIVTQAYDRFGTTVGVAKYLGISQATAVRKLQKYVPDYRGGPDGGPDGKPGAPEGP